MDMGADRPSRKHEEWARTRIQGEHVPSVALIAVRMPLSACDGSRMRRRHAAAYHRGGSTGGRCRLLHDSRSQRGGILRDGL